MCNQLEEYSDDDENFEELCSKCACRAVSKKLIAKPNGRGKRLQTEEALLKSGEGIDELYGVSIPVYQRLLENVVNHYNAKNQLIKTLTKNYKVSFTYDPKGLRTSKTVNGEKTVFVWDGDQLVMELSESGKVKKRYVRGNDLVLADEGNNADISGRTYYVTDSHGNVVQLTDKSGKVTKNYEYDSFGNEVKPEKKDDNPFRYCGEYYDKETGEIYLRARYYQPKAARFLTRDSYTGESDEPESLHLYTYCENDGVNAWDPSGNYTEEKAINLLDKYTKGQKKDKDIKEVLKWWSKHGKFKKKNLFKFYTESWDKFDVVILGFNNYWIRKLKSTKVEVDPNYIKALIKNESTMGTDENMNGKRDVMQIFNPYDPDVHILARFSNAYKYYIDSDYYPEGGGKYGIPVNGYGAVKKLYKKDKKTFVKKRVTPKLSICFGIRWLYYKTQLAGGDVKAGIPLC